MNKPSGSLRQKLYCFLVQNSNHRSMSRILNAKAAVFVYSWSCQEREKKIDDFVRQNCEEYLFQRKKERKKRKPFGSLLQKLYCFLASIILNKKQMTTEFFPVFLQTYAEYLFQSKKKRKRKPFSCLLQKLYCSLASPYQFSVQLCYSRAFFAAFVFPSFFPSFFQNWTGLDVSSNKYQKLVLILVNTGQDNDKEWDELFFIVFFLISKSL